MPGSLGRHPPGRTTQVASLAVEMSTRTTCSGFPTRKAKEDHEPSSPFLYKSSATKGKGKDKGDIDIISYQYCEGGQDIGAGDEDGPGERGAKAEVIIIRLRLVRLRVVRLNRTTWTFLPTHLNSSSFLHDRKWKLENIRIFV